MAKKSKYPAPKRRKVGRNKFVCDFEGQPLVGLSWDSGNGQYFYTFWKSEKEVLSGDKTRKDFSFGIDYQESVFKFKQWSKDTQKFYLTVPTDDAEIEQGIPEYIPGSDGEMLRQIMEDIEIAQRYYKDHGSYRQEDNNLMKMLEYLVIAEPYVQTRFITDKKYAMHLLKQLLQDEEMRIEAIRLLKLDDLLPKEYKKLSLKEISDFYDKENDCSKKEKKQVERTVDHFIEITKKKNINDIEEKDIILFRDVVKALKKSTTFTNGRYTRFKTALSYYCDNVVGSEEKVLVRDVLEICKEKLKKIPTKVNEPAKSFDNVTLVKIFKKAKSDTEMLLMFLVMLNTGFYPTDIRNLKKKMIRRKDRLCYIVFSRIKTGELYKRVNCLWDLTAWLLENQCQKYPNSEYVFISQAGGKYAESTLVSKFTQFFKEMYHSDQTQITSRHFRDTVASSLAFDVNPNIVKVTMGHSINNSNDEFWKYVDNRPEQQKPASDVLYQKFKPVLEVIESFYDESPSDLDGVEKQEQTKSENS